MRHLIITIVAMILTVAIYSQLFKVGRLVGRSVAHSSVGGRLDG